MSLYILPKFKIGQTIYSIKDDKIHQIVIEVISIHNGEIAFLAKNKKFLESQSFASLEEAEYFIKNAIRIPIIKDSWAWGGDVNGVRKTWIKEAQYFYGVDLKKANNMTFKGDPDCHYGSVFETFEEAAQNSRKMLDDYYSNAGITRDGSNK